MLWLGLAQLGIVWHGLPKPGRAQLDIGQSSAWHSMSQLGPRPSLSQLGMVQHGMAWLGTAWLNIA